MVHLAILVVCLPLKMASQDGQFSQFTACIQLISHSTFSHSICQLIHDGIVLKRAIGMEFGTHIQGMNLQSNWWWWWCFRGYKLQERYKLQRSNSLKD